jgi:HSP20 family molecular chaperone IbpA
MTTLQDVIQQSLAALEGNINSSFSGHISDLLQQQGINMRQLWKPSTDIVETKDKLQICMLLPGVSKNSVDVNFFNNSVCVKGERTCSDLSLTTGATHIRKDIIYGKFERNITLPISITRRESVSIAMKEGILTITIDKTVERDNRFSVKIDSSI